MLARLDPTSEELSLCFDPDSDLVGEIERGRAAVRRRQAERDADRRSSNSARSSRSPAQRTNAFVKELEALDLLIDGEVSIQPEGAAQPFIYRGFQMVDEQKLRDMNGDQLRKINQNGILPLIMAHLFSLSHDPRDFRPPDAAGQGPRGGARRWRPPRATPDPETTRAADRARPELLGRASPPQIVEKIRGQS